MNKYDAPIAKALVELADGCESAADVARKLAEAGCQGERQESCSCPVWAWVAGRVQVQADERIQVCAMYVRATGPENEDRGKVRTPSVVFAFIAQFDGPGRFPELVRQVAVQ